MGLVKPDSGRIMLDGQDITGLPMYRRAVLGLGYLPQEPSIFRGLTVAQNIMAVLEVAGAADRARAGRGAPRPASPTPPPPPPPPRPGPPPAESGRTMGRRA